MQTIDGRNGTKPGTEFERLKEQLRKQEEENDNLASGLKNERHLNEELASENAALRNQQANHSDRSGIEIPFSDVSPNSLLRCCTIAAFISFCLMSTLNTVPSNDYESNYIIGSALRFVAQALFALWCMAIYRRDGKIGLVKRFAIWVCGWALMLVEVYLDHPTMKYLEYFLIDAASPVSWWNFPIPYSGADGWIYMLLLWLCLDLTSDCIYSRWMFSHLAILGEKMREVMA